MLPAPMPDTRSHRGPAPGDSVLFRADALPALQGAVRDLSWLLERGYADTSALKLVGDRYALTSRQRIAVRRCACTDARRDARLSRRVEVGALRDRIVHVDGFNALIVSESALSGGVVLIGRDRAHRDLASVHGTWRRVEETPRALEAIGHVLARAAPREVHWLLDRPVGNSGRLRALLTELAAANGWPWSIELDDAPDRALVEREGVIASGDAWILDRCSAWVDLPAAVLAEHEHAPSWIVDLGT